MTQSAPATLGPQRFGKYLLLDKLAEGGMADIFLAVENTPHAGRRFVIIKRIRGEHVSDPDFQEFFLNEGRVSIKCAHPNLVQVYEVDRTEGVYYLAMEFIHGRTLLEFIRGAASRGGRVSVASVVAVGLAVAAALEHAHALRDVDGSPLGVIHRDVSPQNVMIDAGGNVKLIDFGIVRSAVQAHKTKTGVVKGKFSYLAPEQLAPERTADHRADLFSLGVVLHESLTSKPLFRSHDESKTIQNVCRRRIPDPAELRDDVPRAVSAVILRALARDPDERYGSASELLAALDDAASACGLHLSRRRLREELVAACGAPARPEEHLAAAQTPEPEPERTRPRPDLLDGLLSRAASERDPELVYFLLRAGA